MNKKDAQTRKHVVFINADRDYREGKAQNFLRPEDLSRIVHAYRALTTAQQTKLPGYARRVPVTFSSGNSRTVGSTTCSTSSRQSLIARA
jgi:type I restriction enzyme M protein